MHDFHGTFRDLLHAANVRHGTDGFTSPPKEGALRIFSPEKIRWLRPGLNPQTWVLKASTLPLDHRSRTHLHPEQRLRMTKQLLFTINTTNYIIQGGAKRTHVFQIIVTLFIFVISKKTARQQKRDAQRSTAAWLLNWSLCTVLRRSGEVADLHSPDYYPFQKHAFFLRHPV